MLRGVWACFVAACVVSANEENACDRSQLPWDLDLLRHVEDDRSEEELHVAGEYRLAQEGEEQYVEKEGGIQHRMKICDPCTEDAVFRYAISPSTAYEVKLSIRDPTGSKVFTLSDEGGKAVEKTVAYNLKKGESYYAHVIYTGVTNVCTSIFIEISYQSTADLHVPSCTLKTTTPRDSNGQLPELDLIETNSDATSFAFETATGNIAAPGGEKGGEWEYGFSLSPPYRPGFDKMWRLTLRISSDFVLGGDITAMVTIAKKSQGRPTLEECRNPSNGCVFGVRGRMKNTYVIDTSVTVNQLTSRSDIFRYTVWLFRRGASEADAVYRPCAPFHLRVEMRQENLEETFISCDASMLPQNLNSPGFYNKATGEMNVDDYVLLNESQSQQSSEIVPAFDTLLRISVYHDTLDVLLDVRDAAYTTIVKSDNIGYPESLTVNLKKGVYYRINIEHRYDYVMYNDGWEPHCNKAWLRMEASPIKDGSVVGSVTKPDDAPTTPPVIDFSKLATEKLNFTTTQPHYFELATGDAQQIAQYEFDMPSKGTIEGHVLHSFVHGEVVLKLTRLHASSVSASSFKFWGDKAFQKPENVTNPGGDSPPGEGPGPLIQEGLTTKWLDHNKGPLVFDFGKEIAFSEYQFYTSNDHPERDPMSFVLYGSSTGVYSSTDMASNGDLLSNVTYATPALRVHPSKRFSLNETGSYRYLIWIPTALRNYDPQDDVCYSRPTLPGACLNRELGKGRYRLELMSGWGPTDLSIPGVDSELHYQLRLRIEPGSTCTQMSLPKDLGKVERKAFLVGAYRAEPTRSSDDKPYTMSVSFEVVEDALLNLDVVKSEINITAVTLTGDHDTSVAAEDYYSNGLHWMMHKVPAGRYTVTFTFSSAAGTCDELKLQMAITGMLPDSDGETVPMRSIKDLQLNDASGSVSLPFVMQGEIFGFDASKQEHFHNRMHLKVPVEIRIIARFAFEFLHIYIDICECPGGDYDNCPHDNCGKGRGYSVYNGNELEATALPAGFYVIKFYETKFSEKISTRVFLRNMFQVDIAIHEIDSHNKNLTFCGHQLLPSNGFEFAGGLSGDSLDPWFYHTSTEFLVPQPVKEKRSSTTKIHVAKKSVLRVWLPSKPGMSFEVSLFKLQHTESGKSRHANWPVGAPVGKNGVHKKGDALHLQLDEGNYALVIEFIVDDPDECLTYDLEMSVVPVDRLHDPTKTECSNSPDSSFPVSLNSVTHSHTFRHRSLPTTEDYRFQRVIPFNISSVEGGRLHMDLRSTFESGGLTTYVRRKADMGVTHYPVRYLHRDWLRQDLPGPEEYELVVHDMASHEDNVALKDLLNCNRYNIHLSLEDFKDNLPVDCNLHVTNYIPGNLASTGRKVSEYLNIPLPEKGSGRRSFTFELKSLSLIKTWTHTWSGVVITQALKRKESGEFVTVASSSNDANDIISTVSTASKKGKYELVLTFDTSDQKEVDEGSSCNDRIRHTSYDFAVGVVPFISAMLPSAEGLSAPPAEVSLVSDKTDRVPYADYVLRPAKDATKASHTMNITVDESLVGGMYYIVLKYDWLVADVRAVLHMGETLVQPEMHVDPTEEARYTAIMRMSSTIAKGTHTLTIDADFHMENAYLPFYLTLVGAPSEADHAEVQVVDPWVAADVVPQGAFPVRLVLSSPATLSSAKAKAAYMSPEGKEEKLYPTHATFDGSQSVIILYFKLAYGTKYKLNIQPENLHSASKNKAFESSKVSQEAGVLWYSTVQCSCRNGDECDIGSPCGTQYSSACLCDRCPEGSSMKEGVCQPMATTPLPTTKVTGSTDAPTTPAPPTPTPPKTTAPHTDRKTSTPGSPRGKTPAPGTRGGDTHTPSSGGSSGGGNALWIVLLLLVLMGGVMYLAHQRGFVTIPFFGGETRNTPTIVRSADDDLFINDDDEAAADDAERPAAAPVMPTRESEAAGEGQPMLEIAPHDDDDDFAALADPAPPAAAPAAPVEMDDPFADFDPAPPAPPAAAGATDDPFADLDLPTSRH